MDLDGDKKKQNLNPFHLAFHPFFPRINFISSSLTFLPAPGSTEGRDRGCGESMAAPLCCSFLLPLIPALAWGPSQAAIFQDKCAPAWDLCGLQFLQGMSIFSGAILPRGCRGNPAPAPEHLLHLFCSHLAVHTVVSQN